MMGDNVSRNLQPKKNPISQDYRVTGSVLGLGINGKVVECFSHKTGEKFALKVIITQIVNRSRVSHFHYSSCLVACRRYDSVVVVFRL